MGEHALVEGSYVYCHSPDERLRLTISPGVKKKKKRQWHAEPHMPKFNVWAEADHALCTVQVQRHLESALCQIWVQAQERH